MAQSMLLFGAVVSMSLTGATTSACTGDEQHRINALQGGYVAGGFPRITDDCTKAAISVFRGILKDKFSTCLMQKVNISAGCSYCWWGSGQYGFDHCKLQCLGSWCSKKCLDCVSPALPGIVACAGISGPGPTKCDGVPGKLTGAENPVAFLAHTMFGGACGRLFSVGDHVGVEKVGAIMSNGAFWGLAALVCVALVVAGRTGARIGRHIRSRDSYATLVEVDEEDHASVTPDQNEA